MPIIGSRGAASARGFGFGGGIRTTGTYWYATSSSGMSESGNVAQSGLFSMVGSNSTSGGTRAVRFNSNGTITYNTALTSGVAAPAFNGNTSSSSYDICVGNYYYNGDASTASAAFYTLNKSTGAVVAKNTYYYAFGSGYYTLFSSAAAVSDSVCYAAGRLGSTGSFFAQITQLNPSTAAASKCVFLNGFATYLYSVAADSSYVYAVGNSGGWNIIKIDAALSTISWAANLTFSGTFRDAKIAVDGSGNVYVAGVTSNGIELMKLDSSGNLLLQKSITIADVYTVGLAVSTSGSDSYLYICYSVYANKTGVVAKLARSDFSLDSAVSIATSTTDYIQCSNVSNSEDYSILDVFIRYSANYGYTSSVGTLKISSLFSGMYGTFKDELNPVNTITLASVTPTVSSASNTFSSLSPTITTLSPALSSLTAPSISSGGVTTRGKFYVIQP